MRRDAEEFLRYAKRYARSDDAVQEASLVWLQARAKYGDDAAWKMRGRSVFFGRQMHYRMEATAHRRVVLDSLRSLDDRLIDNTTDDAREQAIDVSGPQNPEQDAAVAAFLAALTDQERQYLTDRLAGRSMRELVRSGEYGARTGQARLRIERIRDTLRAKARRHFPESLHIPA